MAITILQTPTTPNVTGTRLVYSVSSSNALQPQFQYVTDIYSGSSLLTRLYTYPNPTGNGIVEVSQILTDNLDYDNDWKTLTGTVADASFKDFKLAFSESYGSSISSSTALYAGGADTTLKAFIGSIDPNDGSFNYQATSSRHFLTDAVENKLSQDNHGTIGVFYPSGSSQDVTFTYYKSNGDSLGTFTDSYSTAVPAIRQIAFASGSTNGSALFQSSSFDYVVISTTGDDNVTYRKQEVCNNEEVTFAFVNTYGYYDYYTVGNPERRVTAVTRRNFDKPNVDYSSATSTYDITRRGTKNYNTEYSDRYEVTTDYLNKSTADELAQLLDSPEVYIQENGNFIPIVITNPTYDWNMNQSRQKLFQFTIQYRYANKRYDR